MRQLVTYWLFHGERNLTAIRGEKGLNDNQVRMQALWQCDTCPGIFTVKGETPHEYRNRLHLSEVRIYE